MGLVKYSFIGSGQVGTIVPSCKQRVTCGPGATPRYKLRTLTSTRSPSRAHERQNALLPNLEDAASWRSEVTARVFILGFRCACVRSFFRKSRGSSGSSLGIPTTENYWFTLWMYLLNYTWLDLHWCAINNEWTGILCLDLDSSH